MRIIQVTNLSVLMAILASAPIGMAGCNLEGHLCGDDFECGNTGQCEDAEAEHVGAIPQFFCDVNTAEQPSEIAHAAVTLAFWHEEYSDHCF